MCVHTCNFCANPFLTPCFYLAASLTVNDRPRGTVVIGDSPIICSLDATLPVPHGDFEELAIRRAFKGVY